MTCGIYKITNKINQKIYIGQSKNIEYRWKQHIYEMNENYKSHYSIHKALKKYGIENFTFEIIEIIKEEELFDREKYWIQYYNSYNKGYNETIGGDSGPALKGEKNPKAKLKNTDVLNIRNRLLMKETPGEVYEDYKNQISKSAFLKIWRGETWKDICPEAISYVKTPEYLHIMKSKAAKIQHQKRRKSND